MPAVDNASRHDDNRDVRELRSFDALTGWLRGEVAARVDLKPSDVRGDKPFSHYGLNSIRATGLMAALSDAMGRRLPPALLWAHPTIDSLAEQLLAGGSGDTTHGEHAAGRAVGRTQQPIAVVGLACRFPLASGPDAYWQLLQSGTDAVALVPPGRWDASAHLGVDPVGETPVPRHAGFLREGVDLFDPLFFGISPREAHEVDPQQRLFLEVAWEALEDAGIANESLEGSRTGVFAGAIWHDYADLGHRRRGGCSSHSATGQALNMIANRLSYVLGLRGPSVVLNSACSSSLLAIHQACLSLWAGESTAAIAGGVNLMLSAATMEALTRFGGLSPDGRCKAFDARADGFGRGEGCGVVVLKPLARALADDDDIWCTIRGSAVNNDGLSNGLTAPNPAAQEEVLRDAYRNAGVTPSQVHFVETHGTGTMLGDPIEAMALGAAVSRGRPRPAALRIGSVKTNLGHLEAAAGVAGFIKVALCLRERKVPPNLHFEAPNPHIDFDGLGLRVPSELEPWPADRPRLAGVSSFGWGGTNVHTVLEGWDEPSPLRLPAAPLGVSRPRIVYVCSPHGHQWIGMGRLLYRTEPVFRAVIQQCDVELKRYAAWSIVDELFAADEDVRFEAVDIVQPVLFAMQVALAAWLEAAGARPDAVVGHSLGEVAAAVIAGVLDLPDAVRLVYHYSGQQRRLAGQGGGMAIVELSAADLEECVDGAGGAVTVAAENGPTSTALSGEVGALEVVLAQLKARDVLCARIRVDLAAHSAAIDPVMEDLRRATADIVPRAGRIPMVSAVTGRPVDWHDVGADYFVRNLRERVRLADATSYLLSEGFDVLLEVSAEPVLASALQQSVEASGRVATVLGSMRRGTDDRSGLIDTLSALAGLGAVVDLPGRSTRADVPELVTFSAKTPAALAELAGGVAATMDAARAQTVVREIARAAARRRDHPYRLAAVTASRVELSAALNSYAAGVSHPCLVTSARAAEKAPRVAFIFPGQGSQWVGMGRELLRREPVFQAALRACDAAARAFVDWSILGQLDACEELSLLGRVDVVQPVLFAIQVGLAELWRSWGVEPHAVVGHSMGEAAAAHVAGALSLDHALQIICLRSRLMRRTSGQGGMLVVELDLDAARCALEGHEQEVSIAVNNSPRSTVLSGGVPALERIAATLQAREVFCRWVKVDVASHSPQMDPLRADLLDALRGIAPRPSVVPIHSTVTGGVVAGGDLDELYWVRNLREPVLFSAQIARLLDEGVTAFVEMSPHPILLPAVEQVAAHAGRAASVLPSMRRHHSERDVMLRSLGQLYVLGMPIGPSRPLTPAARGVKLPPYPWQRERFWMENLDDGGAPRAGDGGHPLLGARLDSAVEEGRHYWLRDVDLRTAGVGDHRIGGASILPGAAYVEMALAAAAEIFSTASIGVCDARFQKPFIVPDHGYRRMQTVVTRTTDRAAILVFAQGPGRDVCVAEATLAPATGRATRVDLAELTARMDQPLDGTEYYRILKSCGLDYGPAFQGIQRIARCAGESLARLSSPQAFANASSYRLHPSLLDAALQAALAPALGADWGEHGGRAFLNEGIGRVIVYRRPTEPVWAHAVLRRAGEDAGAIEADVSIIGDDGSVLIEVTAVRILLLGRPPRFTEPVTVAVHGVDTGTTTGLHAEGQPAASVATALLLLDSRSERRAVLEEIIRDSVGQVVKLSAARIDLDRPLNTLGIDSVMSLELRNRLESRLAIELSASLIWNYPTIRGMAPFIAEKLGLSLDHAPHSPSAPTHGAVSRHDEVSTGNGMADDELALMRELNGLSHQVDNI